MAAVASIRERFEQWLADHPDDTVLRWIFGAALASTAAVLVLDYWQMNEAAEQQATLTPAERTTALPSAQPSTSPLPQVRQGGERRRGPLRVADKQLGQAMTFDLAADGKLIAVGTITPGTAETFAAEVAKRGSYVKTVVLHSPGGSVQDALKMGQLIREKKFNTEVENSRYCASSCPLVFASGVERKAGDKASIGVHQVFAPAGAEASLGSGMESAQRVSAQCQKYLRDMGVDLAVWMHAMETPKEELYYFTPEELLSLKLATQSSGKGAAGKV